MEKREFTIKDEHFTATRDPECTALSLDNTVSKQKSKHKYYTDIVTFDIETTTTKYKDIEYFGFMYHFQFCINGALYYGRTFEELETFFHLINKEIGSSDTDGTLVIYVHNLSYEYQFIYQMLEKIYGELDVFAVDRRKPLVARCGHLEFRCSYKLTNMSLYRATLNELGVEHVKLKDDLDYHVYRDPYTELEDTEFAYCMVDVLSLYELIKCRLINYGDTLASIPLTSTGYPRRDCFSSCSSDGFYMQKQRSLIPKPMIYTLLKEASRGGDCSSNRILRGQVIEGVDGYDAVSSYPYQLLTQKYPMSPFYEYGKPVREDELLETSEEYALLFRASFIELRIKTPSSHAYVSLDKARSLDGQYTVSNGRVLYAEVISLTLTDLDYKIIRKNYDYDDIVVDNAYMSRYDYLPSPIRKPIFEYFTTKCRLKQEIKRCKNEEQKTNLKYLYGKSKNSLNGIFGMMFTDVVRDEIIFDSSDLKLWRKEKANLKQSLSDAENRPKSYFLSYQWGVWTTAHARYHLHRLLDITGARTIYYDTDSDYFIRDDTVYPAIERLNDDIINRCRERNAFFEENGETMYLGIFEREKENLPEFKTLGAKKYAYVDNNKKLNLTISGVNKETGAAELGSIENFRPGFTFRESGGNVLHYNTIPYEAHKINDKIILCGSNIGMQEGTYEIGQTLEYGANLFYNAFTSLC